MLIDAPPTLLNTIIHKNHLSHFMAKSMNELAHKSPLINLIISFSTCRQSFKKICTMGSFWARTSLKQF